MNFTHLSFIFLLICAYMTVWFIISSLMKRSDLLDVAWGLGFVLVAHVSLLFSGNIHIKTLLVVFLVTLWGFRLAIHIYLRNKDKEEDYRYKKFRKEWGKFFLIRSYLQLFLSQGILMFLISFQVLIVSLYSKPEFRLLNLIGVIIWLIGFLFETIGDYQLSIFIKKKDIGETDAKIMQKGLWKYTRHPNYFGEVILWWGMFLISIGTKFWPWALISPLVITILILGISGIPLLEEKYEDNQDYQEYKKRTSAFFPLPKRSDTS